MEDEQTQFWPGTPMVAEMSSMSFGGPVSGRHRSESGSREWESPGPSARDPHDSLVNQMFGVSLELHSALARIEDRVAAEKVRGAIREIDAAITSLRQLVIELRSTTRQ